MQRPPNRPRRPAFAADTEGTVFLLLGLLLVIGFLSLGALYVQVATVEERTARGQRDELVTPLGSLVNGFDRSVRDSMMAGETSVDDFFARNAETEARLRATAAGAGVYLSFELDPDPDPAFVEEHCGTWDSDDSRDGVIVGYDESTQAQTVVGAVYKVHATDGRETLRFPLFVKIFDCLDNDIDTFFDAATLVLGESSSIENAQRKNDGNASMEVSEAGVGTTQMIELASGLGPLVAGTWTDPANIYSADDAYAVWTSGESTSYVRTKIDTTGVPNGPTFSNVRVRVDIKSSGVVDDVMQLTALGFDLQPLEGPFTVSAPAAEASSYYTLGTSPSGDATWTKAELGELTLAFEQSIAGSGFDVGATWSIDFTNIEYTYTTTLTATTPGAGGTSTADVWNDGNNIYASDDAYATRPSSAAPNYLRTSIDTTTVPDATTLSNLRIRVDIKQILVVDDIMEMRVLKSDFTTLEGPFTVTALAAETTSYYSLTTSPDGNAAWTDDELDSIYLEFRQKKVGVTHDASAKWDIDYVEVEYQYPATITTTAAGLPGPTIAGTWATPANIYADDGTGYAVWTANEATSYLRTAVDTSTLPPGHTFTGLRMRVDAKSLLAVDDIIELRVLDGDLETLQGPTTITTLPAETTTWVDLTVSPSGDAVWTANEIGEIRVELMPKKQGLGLDTLATWSVDFVELEYRYTIADRHELEAVYDWSTVSGPYEQHSLVIRYKYAATEDLEVEVWNHTSEAWMPCLTLTDTAGVWVEASCPLDGPTQVNDGARARIMDTVVGDGLPTLKDTFSIDAFYIHSVFTP